MRSDEAGPVVGRIIERLQRPYHTRDRKARIARALIFRDPHDASAAELGIAVPAIFSKSDLIIKYMGDISEAALLIANVLSQNEPFFVMDPLVLPRGSADKAQQIAIDQQDLLNAQWAALMGNAGRDLQRIISWGQAVDGVGWYYTVPRDVDFGLPDRKFYEERTGDEIEEMIRTGEVLHEEVDGRERFVERGDVWFKRRREQSRQDAIDGKTLFHLDALGDPTIYTSEDAGGIAMGLISEALPRSLLEPGSDLANLAADFLGNDAWADLGMQVNEEGCITHGVPRGGGQHDSGGLYGSGHDTFGGVTLHKLFTRDSMTYVLSSSPHGTGGKVIFHSDHTMGRVPLEPVPYYDTGEAAPDKRYVAGMDGILAVTPILNNTVTFLTNMGAYAAFPRYVIETKEGGYVDDHGNPKVIERNDTIGLDPQEVVTIHGGTVKLLDVGDPGVLQSVVGFFLERDQDSKPNDAERGAAGNATAAWSVRINDANSQRARKAAQDHHARAVANIGTFWIDLLRLLPKGTRLGFITAPGQRSTRDKARYLLEVKPEDLVRLVRVTQSNRTLEEQAVLAQIGEARAAAGRIDDITLARDFYEVTSPENEVKKWWSQRAFEVVMLGPNDRIAETGLLKNIADAARGVAIADLTANSPAFAIELAKAMAIQMPPAQFDLHPDATGHEGGDDFNRGLGGPTSQAAGVRPPGMGAGVNQAALPARTL